MSTPLVLSPPAGAVAWSALAAPRRDGLTPVQRRLTVAAIVGLHGLAFWELLQVDAVREAVRESAPMFVEWIAPPAPAVVPPPPKPEPPKPVAKRIEPAPRPRPSPIVTTAPSPAPAPFVVPAAEPAPPLPAAVVAAPAPPAPPAPPVAPPPAPPREIPPSAVQYLVEPAPDYPRLSARAGEVGRVLVRLLIDEHGLPQQVQIARSSGFARLDAAALAAVQKARFRPPTLNGQPITGWANVPIDFGLEK